jgi:hypothetical protein
LAVFLPAVPFEAFNALEARLGVPADFIRHTNAINPKAMRGRNSNPTAFPWTNSTVCSLTKVKHAATEYRAKK